MDYTLAAKQIYELFPKLKTRKIADFIDDGFKGCFIILKILVMSENEVCAGYIAEKLEISTARIAVALENLEQKGLLKKSKSSNDKRKTIVQITEEGKKLLVTKETNILQHIAKNLEKLTENEITTLITIIQKLGNESSTFNVR